MRRSIQPNDRPRTAARRATVAIGLLALGLLMAGCAEEADTVTAPAANPQQSQARESQARKAGQVDATAGTRATNDAGGEAAVVLPDLAPDRMPPQLADFPLPDDIVFVEPPRYEFGRLIVVLNSQMGEDEVATLFNAELEARGYEITKTLDIGAQRWRFVKDGRLGLVDVDQNNRDMPTAITINLFVEDAP